MSGRTIERTMTLCRACWRQGRRSFLYAIGPGYPAGLVCAHCDQP